MAGIRQIAKLRTGDDRIDRAVAHMADTLNPVLRALPTPQDFRTVELPGQNGAAPTYALQYTAGGGAWTTIVEFTAAGQIVQMPWIPPDLLNGWVNFNPGNSIAGYMKDSVGFVHLRGTVKSGTVGGGVPIFILPAAFRPSAVTNFPVVSNALFGVISVTAAGLVVLVIGSNVYCDLDGINFDTR